MRREVLRKSNALNGGIIRSASIGQYTIRLIMIIAVLYFGAIVSSVNAAEKFIITTEGRANCKIITSKNPSKASKEAARILVNYLKKISGADFSVNVGDGTNEIAVGLYSEFPRLKNDKKIKLSRLASRDVQTLQSYIIRTHEKGIQLIGASDIGLIYGVWDLLHRLGYRQFFPGKLWEVIPENKNLSLALVTFEKPDFFCRYISAGTHIDWDFRNRMDRGMGTFKVRWPDYLSAKWKNPVLMNQHAFSYWNFAKTHKKLFEEHPECLALVKGERITRGGKMCYSNPMIQELAKEYVLNYFKKHPGDFSVSMEPSDGSFWCECEKCKAMGSISDRVAFMLNLTAKTIKDKYPNKSISALSYHMHAPPPEKIKLDPNIIVTFANGLSKTKYSILERMDRWKKIGLKHFGVYEYLAVYAWYRTMPNKAQGADLSFLAQSIPNYYRNGVRYYTGEGDPGWGACGLGYYFASRILWDIKNAQHVDEIAEDFVSRSFGKAKKPMSQFYKEIDASEKIMGQPVFYLLKAKKMYKYLRKAKALAENEDVHQRINALIGYTHYIELRNWTCLIDNSSDKKIATERRNNFSYRVQENSGLTAWLRPSSKDSLKSPFTEKEISNILSGQMDKDLADKAKIACPLLSLELKTFSKKLVPATVLKLAEAQPVKIFHHNMSPQSYYAWIPENENQLTIKVGSNIKNKGKQRRVQFFNCNLKKEKLVDTHYVEVPQQSGVLPKEEKYNVILKSPYSGLHRIEVSKGPGITWDEGTKIVLEPTKRSWFSIQSAYVYVPKGTKYFAGITGSYGSIVDSDGEVRYFKSNIKPDKTKKYFEILVKKGQDGKLWLIKDFAAFQWVPLSVPPYFCRNEKELLIPEEVLKNDIK